MKRLLAALFLSVFAITSATPVIAAEKKDEKKTEKKDQKQDKKKKDEKDKKDKK